MILRLAIIALLLYSAIHVCPAFCQDNSSDQQIQTVKGKIVDIDWVGSKMVVRWYDPQELGMDEITFVVSRQTRITKGTSEITLSDLIRENSVTVQYYDRGFSGLAAVSIKVDE